MVGSMYLYIVPLSLLDVHDYFMKPAQTRVASVEVGSEGYCSVYPEAEVEPIYTVCRVPDNDTKVCSLIAHNMPNCCICGNPGCNQALGEGVNTSLGVTPAHAVYPGIDSCIVYSEHALTFDCFVQRSSRFGTSLKQHTGTISYCIPLSPTTAFVVNQTATDVYCMLTIGLSVALAVAVLGPACLIVTSNVLSVMLCKCRKRLGYSILYLKQPDGQDGEPITVGRFNFVFDVCGDVYAHVYMWGIGDSVLQLDQSVGVCVEVQSGVNRIMVKLIVRM